MTTTTSTRPIRTTTRWQRPDMMAHAIGARLPFVTSGAMHGQPLASWDQHQTGYLPADQVESFRAACQTGTGYAVWSYGTPILWTSDGTTWTYPTHRYSVTTSKHQGRARGALPDSATVVETGPNRTRVQGTIAALSRRPLSRNGNPAWDITLDTGEAFRTSADAGISYAIGNPEYRGVPVVLSLTNAGRVWDVTVA